MCHKCHQWLDKDFLLVTGSGGLTSQLRLRLTYRTGLYSSGAPPSGEPRTRTFIFSFPGVKIVFWVEMAGLGHMGRGVRDVIKKLLPELRTEGCTGSAAPIATGQAQGQKAVHT